MNSAVVKTFTLYDWYQLVRPRLSLMVSLAALCGYLASPAPHSSAYAALMVVGVFLLTAAASILNQVQERERDRLLPRTRQRPLAAGRMEPLAALMLASVHLLLALQLLNSVSQASAAIGLLALIWYNLIYTPLKSKTSLALLLGALGGALPPLLGWAASGTSLFAPRAVHLYLVMVLWQVPHFWCLAMRDGLPERTTELRIIPPAWGYPQLVRMVRLWCLALGALLLTSPPLGLVTSPMTQLLLSCIALWCCFLVAGKAAHRDFPNWATATGIKLHIVLAATLALVTLDPLLSF